MKIATKLVTTVIERCSECPYSNLWQCNFPGPTDGQVVSYVEAIPDWCPLPDAPAEGAAK